ncbi:MAG: M20/M25/M40 family metallo-hydrolase [Bifidobacteriaceae bacterium]|jgi:acetylornithine deacetylase/succinyl-diaminopimelate desuccinylase-like protein|nr:M20/M25/M40 family metallo-hydrolase [Bifidobacteriaceae bacterium]
MTNTSTDPAETPLGPSAEAIIARVGAVWPEVLDKLKHLVAIPSFNTPTAEPGVLDRSADYVADLMREAGVQDVAIIRTTADDGTPGGPGVVGSIPAPPGAPTVLLYAHHDVQPVADDWSTDPFTMTEKDGRVYGRGTSDDGAGVVTHFGALKALGEDLGVGIAIFIEGEEESGSPTFAKLLHENADRLRADVAIIGDSGNWRTGVPGLTVTLRGICEIDFTLRVSAHAVHSGEYGGPLLDAPLLACRLISTLHDADGAVAVEGLAPTGHSTLDYPEADYRADTGAVPSLKLAGRGSIADRLWWSPSITLIGMDVTPVDESSGTIRPTCRARLSLRVPPGMDVLEGAAAVERHLVSHAPFGAEVEVVRGAAGASFELPEGMPAAAAARWALGRAYGTECVDVGQGGSIPLVADLRELYPDLQVLMTGMADQDSRAHSGDESYGLADLRHGVEAEALLLARLAADARNARA